MKLIKYIFFFFITIFLAGILIIRMNVFPEIDNLINSYETIEPSVIYDCKGREIDKIYKENREICSIKEVPEKLIEAILSVEDKDFFYHRGFGFKRILKALYVNIFSCRKVQGASTITQQLAKNAFLNNDKTIKRKIKEALITIQIERKYTKSEILGKYLNEIYFGKGIYGIKTATRYFFRKSLEKLTLNEIAILASIPKVPDGSCARLNIRRKYVLKKMFNYSFISKEEYESNVNKDIELKKFHFINKIPSFTDIIIEKISNLFTHKQLKEGGLKIFTTLDLDCQLQAQKAFDSDKFLQDNPDIEGALVSIDPFNGNVKAVIAGKKFISGHYNRAIKAKRQIGSAFKPIVFLGAILEGYPLNLIIEDSPLKFDKWEPNNYDLTFMGNVTLMESLYFSRNTSSIKLLQKVGIKKIIKLANEIGIKSEIPFNLSIALGTSSSNALEMATAYCVIVNGGYKIEPNFLECIKDKYENLVYLNEFSFVRVSEERSIALLLHILKNNLKSEMFKKGDISKIEKGGKSGTTNNYKDAWFCAFTSDLVTALYLGNDDNKGMPEGSFGGNIVAPIWKSYMENLIENGYVAGKFEFERRLLKSNSLKYKNLDSKTGLLNKNGKKFLIKREHVPVESFKKYKNGLDFILN